MVREALTGYWTLVSGLTEVTVERARAAARAMLAQGEATRDQVSGLAQEITDASRTNREALIKLVRFEAERAAGRLGFASTDEVTTLQGRVRELERSIAALRTATEPVAQPAAGRVTPAAAPPKKTAAAKAAAAKKAAKAPATKAARKPAEPPVKAAEAAKASKAAKAAPGKVTGERTSGTAS